MTQQLATLDTGEIALWLNQVARTVDRSLREPIRSAAAALLRGGLDPDDKLSLSVLIPLAFLCDCLHVAHLAIHADGQVEAAEIDRVAPLVRVAATKYFVALPAYESFEDGAPNAADVVRFLTAHRTDSGAFGLLRTEPWRGLMLARMVEHATRNAAPLQEHERMLVRVMEVVFAGRATEVERAARRQLRELFEQPIATVGTDPRAVAFCRSDGPEVFSTIAHSSHFHERDPFDVETIHADARGVFHQQVERATTPEQTRRGHGHTLLVLGASGAGKTHLLRALRTQVHARRLGYVGYLQLTADVDDPARHVLRSLIDSLEQPYDAPSLSESCLMYLSDGLVEARDAISPDELEQLRTADLSTEQLEQLVGKLVDRVVRIDGLAGLENDLVQALLLLQRRDPALQRRIVRFLRGEPLTNYDRQMLGGLAARDRPEDHLRTIRDLATVMHELQLAALVLVVDQLEDAVPDGHNVSRLQRALDVLRAIGDAVPSSVIVISCLEDVYDAHKGKLSQTLLDRLERTVVRLGSRRQPDEIEQMLVRRLEHLYSFFDVAWREDDPLYPFTPAQIEAVSQLRTRDCLGKFREFHAACIAAHAIVPVGQVARIGASAAGSAASLAGNVASAGAATAGNGPIAPTGPVGASRAVGAASAVGSIASAAQSASVDGSASAGHAGAVGNIASAGHSASVGGAASAGHAGAAGHGTPAAGAGSGGAPAASPDLERLDRLWTETLAGAAASPDDDQILALIADAIRGAGTERGIEVGVRSVSLGVLPHLIIEGGNLRRRVVALCNNPPQGGSFAAQLGNLRVVASKVSAVAIALRSGDFKFQPKSKTAQHVGDHIANGGLAVPLPEAALRVATAVQRLSAVHPAGLLAWRRDRRPLGELGFVRQILDLDRDHASDATAAAPVAVASAAAANAAAEYRGTADAPGPDGGPRAAPADEARRPRATQETGPTQIPTSVVRLGVVDSLRADPILMPLEDIKIHMAFLGSTGSGKTTAALSVVEQLLERSVSVVLVDRKGDLARYVSDAWWSDASVPEVERARRRTLRDRIDLALFTPGNPHGRPLRLPLVPPLAELKSQEREQLARYAAESLGAMMGYGKSAAHRHKMSILQCAIALHGEAHDITLDLLKRTIERPDSALLAEVGALQRHFASLAEDLQTLRIQRGALLSGDGEPLDLAALLPPPGTARARLSIINTSALTELPVLQFWISRLLVELGRLGRKRPSPTLQAAAFFDEADAYVPAMSSPPTKEPMFDLLRRSRSTGIGVLLATQNPGDFDYKARDNINTWLLGKIAQDTAIAKMRNLIGSYPDVGPRLASQRTGSFFLLTASNKRELKADRSMMETMQLSESEVAELARRTRPPTSVSRGRTTS